MAPLKARKTDERWSFASAVGLVWRGMSLQRRGDAPDRCLVVVHSWRHRATSLPCTATCSAGSTIGS
jgi:hypothetical protein